METNKIYNMDCLDLMKKIVERAEKIAREAHKGQIRWDGKEYITHPQRVAMSFKDLDCRIVSWLHDVIEDTDVKAQDLVTGGIPVRLVNSVKNLTRLQSENYFMYIMRIKHDKIATKVKISDIEDNLNDGLKEGSLKDKYRLARYILKTSGAKKEI